MATTVEDQIDKLKSRGMTIEDEAKAKENLLDIGYYRLGFYWFPFENTYPRRVNRDHTYREGTRFDYAIRLYYFDFDLRNLFLRYISRIEINFRTTLIYYVSNKYKNDPFWYINQMVVKKDFIESNVYQAALKEAEGESVVKADLKLHNRRHAPAWKVIEYMSFGVTISLFDNLKDGGLKKQISMVYGMDASSQFSNYINTVRRLRNYCAHGKVLYDLNLPEAISSGPAGNLGNRKTMLSGAYIVFKYLLGTISKKRVDEMKSGLISAFDRITDKAVLEIILQNSGFNLDEL